MTSGKISKGVETATEMFNRLKKYTQGLKEKRLDGERQNMLQKIRSLTQEDLRDVAAENVKSTGLGQMTVGIQVVIESAPFLEFALARFLFPGKENATEISPSYSWDSFLHTLVDKLNFILPEQEAQYGWFDYITSDGKDMKQVVDQDSFEVALNHLWGRRYKDEMLLFQFHPEPNDTPSLRLSKSVESRLATKPESEPTEYGVEGKVEGRGDTSSEEPKPAEYLTILDDIGEQPKSSTPIVGVNTAPTSSTTEERPSTAGSASAPGNLAQSKTNRKSHLKDTISKIRGKKTADEKRLRLKSLWEEAERIFYRKGDNDAEEENLAEIAERDSQDGSISDEEDDEENEVSHEDKVVTKWALAQNIPILWIPLHLLELSTTETMIGIAELTF